jgi:hypothetical protein
MRANVNVHCGTYVRWPAARARRNGTPRRSIHCLPLNLKQQHIHRSPAHRTFTYTAHHQDYV